MLRSDVTSSRKIQSLCEKYSLTTYTPVMETGYAPVGGRAEEALRARVHGAPWSVRRRVLRQVEPVVAIVWNHLVHRAEPATLESSGGQI